MAAECVFNDYRQVLCVVKTESFSTVECRRDVRYGGNKRVVVCVMEKGCRVRV